MRLGLAFVALGSIMFGVYVMAAPVHVVQDDNLQGTGGAKISGLALTSARWTGWIYTGNMRALTFDIDFTDANSSVTAVTMVCESTRDNSTANDAGRDLHSISVAGGTATSTALTWSYTTAGSKAWTWTVDNINHPYINCEFDGTGTPAAADVITVYARAKTP